MFKKTGFTLVEILLVIVILGILAAIVIPRITYTQDSARKEACKANKAAINSQLELYLSQVGSCPTSAIYANETYFPDGVPTCPVDATNYTINATRCRVSGHTH